MASTYTPLATTTLGSATSSYTFSSIPSTYTDLVLVMNGKLASGAESLLYRLNGDSGGNYSFTYLVNAASGRATNTSFGLCGYFNSSNPSTSIAYFMNYSNSTTYKTSLDRRGGADTFVGADVSLWRNTAAITSIQLFPENGASFASGTTLTLYGIKAA